MGVALPVVVVLVLVIVLIFPPLFSQPPSKIEHQPDNDNEHD
jgi:hypothetical protein